MEQISIANLEIDVVRKDIKNMHLAVYPPVGRIRLAAPEHTDPEIIRLFAISKLGWIKKHVKGFKESHRESPRKYISGEAHYFLGKKYMLEVKEDASKNTVELKGTKKIIMNLRLGTSYETRQRLMKEWYRAYLKSVVPALIDKWEQVIEVKSSDWQVKHMKTKWGSCKTDTKRILLNLELAKKPMICLEYIIVHELVHLIERNHNDNFIRLLNKFMPKWRLHRDELNRLPVSHVDWDY
ncbi:MAG: M48 family peptidase [Bacteroidetes bacterium]|nr:MAG: M48 family peptidase [Bacteroidota bacterium]MBL1144968.1 M48 family peptidase [Bacteroidota bacterium]NOG57762.1 M48 family metallopeptidase [Bacteroidota bacterium]